MAPLERDIKSYVEEEIGFKFENPKIETDNSNIESLNYEDFDLILMDYALSGGENGDTLISKIREHNFFSEIVFYSSRDVDDLRKAILENKLDGVYCAGRSAGSFLPKVKEVIKVTIRKMLDLNAMRGIVMAETSDIDEKMLEIISAHIQSLDDESSISFLNSRRKKLLSSLDEKIKKLNESDLNLFYYNWLFDSSHKWRAVLNIVKNKMPEKEALTKLYDAEIIKKRDRLAHVKESTDADGQKQLADGDFVFDEKTSKEILTALKKHEENMNRILEALR
jgi:DNA-binding NarL/FixJ family response regulator